MTKDPDPWKNWGARFRELVQDRGSDLAKVGAAMTPQRAESSVRSWTNGVRKINLVDFFALCEAAKLDPAVVLFGRPLMSEEQRRQLGELATSILEADPVARESYGEFTGGVRKSVRARKAAQARAPSRLKTS